MVNAYDTKSQILSPVILSQQVGSYLMRQLVTGQLRPGDRINEAELARRLGISRNPIREALNRLEERGLLVGAPHRGRFVRAMTKQDVDELFAFRIALEDFALIQAMPRIGAREVDDFAKMVEAMEAAAEGGDEARLTELDLAFHLRICELSANRRVLGAFANIQSEVQMLIALADQRFDSLHAAAADHWPIVDAFSVGDHARSQAALRAHIEDAWSRFAQEVEPARAVEPALAAGNEGIGERAGR